MKKICDNSVLYMSEKSSMFSRTDKIERDTKLEIALVVAFSTK